MATNTAGRIKKIIGIKILVAAVAPNCSARDDLFTLSSFDNCLRIGPIEAPTESAAIKVAQNELISIMFTRQLSCLKPSAREEPILVSRIRVSNSSTNGLGGAFSITR